MKTALFIKRAEEYQSEEFIIGAFRATGVGEVGEVKFIKKQCEKTGRFYNGVIVVFEKLHNTTHVWELFNEMATSKNGTARFYFDEYGRYWIMNVHKQKMPDCHSTSSLSAASSLYLDDSLPDKDKVVQLKGIADTLYEQVSTLTSQSQYMQTRLEQMEKTVEETKHDNVQYHLYNAELKTLLEEKENEVYWLKKESERSKMDQLQMLDKIQQLEQEVREYEEATGY